MATTRKLLAFIDNLLAKCAWIRQLKKTRTLPKEKAYSRKISLKKKYTPVSLHEKFSFGLPLKTKQNYKNISGFYRREESLKLSIDERGHQ